MGSEPKGWPWMGGALVGSGYCGRKDRQDSPPHWTECERRRRSQVMPLSLSPMIACPGEHGGQPEAFVWMR